MIIVYGRYVIHDPAATGAFEESSRRFVEFGRSCPGNQGFSIARDMFDPTTVHMHQLWESRPLFESFTATPEHDRRIEETKKFGAAGQITRADLIFFDGEIYRHV
ncbi:MAG: antibiotic biosynthesis monooxygenase [Acidimicrobiales bacterium]|nr:antibiotic biosynthesis monooxygenase [Acidimicrobiales bacterium]